MSLNVRVKKDGVVVNTIVVNSEAVLGELGINEYELVSEQAVPTVEDYEAALDNHLDSVARQYRYRDREMFALRSGYPGPYREEGVAFGTWMDTCNKLSYELWDAVTDGTAEVPTIQQFIDSLPIFVKPQ